MPDKITDLEIVKALEELVKCNNNEIDCGSCSLNVFYPRCPEEIGELTLNLINRLQAENKNLKAEVEKQKKKVEMRNFLISKQQAENERLLQELQYPQADTVQKKGDTSNDKERT